MDNYPTVSLPLVPLSVPTEVRIRVPQAGTSGYPTIPLVDLSEDALYALTDAWLKAVYAAAKKRRPVHRPKEMPDEADSESLSI